MRRKLGWLFVVGCAFGGLGASAAQSGPGRVTPRSFEILKTVAAPDGSTIVSYRATLGHEAGMSALDHMDGSAVYVRQNGHWRMLRIINAEQVLEFQVPEIVEAVFP